MNQPSSLRSGGTNVSKQAVRRKRRRLDLRQAIRVAIWITLLAAGLDDLEAAPANGLTVTIARRDLRPLPGVALTITGAANRQGITDDAGRATFAEVPPAGAMTIAPSRSGFRFEPAQLTVADVGKSPDVSFTGFPTATDLELSLASDDATPLAGGFVNLRMTVRNAGAEAATDVAVAFSSLPGLTLEEAQATRGTLDFQAYQTVLRIPQLEAGASAEIQARSRATLPNANVLTIASVDEMDQADVNPLNNMAELITRPRPAFSQVALALTIDPGIAKVGDTIPVRLTVRNDGPNDATQLAIRTYLPPGTSLTVPAEGLHSSSLVIPRLAAGTQLQFGGALRARWPGTFPLIANVTSFEQQLPPGTAWPEARGNFTVQPAFARLTLFAFSDPPNPRVGEEVTVTYVARNEGPDTVTGLDLFTRADARLGTPLTARANQPPPPLPGPFVFGDVLPVGAYTYQVFQHTVKAAGELTNYFTVEYQDQLVANGGDHPELYLSIKTLPSDIGLSLDANPREITARAGDPVTIEFPVHNDGPQPARGLILDYDTHGLVVSETDEIIHADRVVRPQFPGFIDIVQPNETVTVRKRFVALTPGLYTNFAQIKLSFERPDLLMPITYKATQVRVLPGAAPDLAITVNVDKPQVNVGEYAIFIVTVANRAAQPAFNVWVKETDTVASEFSLETVRSYGPGGDIEQAPASDRLIPRLDPGASYSMSRTMRVRKPGTIPYTARITGVNALLENDLPGWAAHTEITGVQVESDIAPLAMADRVDVKVGDLVNFVVVHRNLSQRVASHPALTGGVGAGFQMLNNDLRNYGYFFDWSRPRDVQPAATPLTEWIEIGSQQKAYSYFSTYAVKAGPLNMAAQLSQLDQLDANVANNLTELQINSASAQARISVKQSTIGPAARVGEVVPFVTEIRNEGPDRVTGLAVVETTTPNLELSYNSAVTGISGDVATSFLDTLVRLPPLEPGQNFVWQRTFSARAPGDAVRRVEVAAFDQTSIGPLAQSDAPITIQSAEADIRLEFLAPPKTAPMTIDTPVNVRVRNFGPGVATRVKIGVTGDGVTVSGLGYGPRAGLDLLSTSTFQVQLLPGESAIVGFYVTPTREGPVTAFVGVKQADQSDPNPGNETLTLPLHATAVPPFSDILRVRKVRTDFFDQTPIAEIEINQAELNRLAPITTFSLEASSNLVDWEYLRLVGWLPLAPVTVTDHVAPGVRTRAYRLRR